MHLSGPISNHLNEFHFENSLWRALLQILLDFGKNGTQNSVEQKVAQWQFKILHSFWVRLIHLNLSDDTLVDFGYFFLPLGGNLHTICLCLCLYALISFVHPKAFSIRFLAVTDETSFMLWPLIKKLNFALMRIVYLLEALVDNFSSISGSRKKTYTRTHLHWVSKQIDFMFACFYYSGWIIN